MDEPRHIAPAIRQFLNKIAGCDTEDQKLRGLCVPKPIGCGGPAVMFHDDLSRKEYSISGLCQSCQDLIFKASDDDDKL